MKESKMQNYGLILAGGNGTRFWPLSRKKRPKQVLNLIGKGTMIGNTIARLTLTIPKENVFILTNSEQYECISKAVNCSVPEQNILVEPAARNTAACIGWAAEWISKRTGDGVLTILPSDHYIEREDEWAHVIQRAVEKATETDLLYTVGIEPRYPSTGYGYIHRGEQIGNGVYTVSEFREKPDEETAKEYLSRGKYSWNSGILVGKASTILSDYAMYAPDIFKKLEDIASHIGASDEDVVLTTVYPEIRSISIDYAILETAAKDGRIAMIPGDFGWSDVGSWDALEQVYATDRNGNIFSGDVIPIESRGCIAYSSKRPIVMLHTEDIIAIETEEAVLICPRKDAQKIREVTEVLQKSGRDYLL